MPLSQKALLGTVALLVACLCGVLSVMLSRPPTFPQPSDEEKRDRDFDDGGFADICAIEYTIALSTPPAVEPPTFFEILHLDPYAYPFHPVESSSRIGGARTEAAERVIRDAWLERVGEYETADGGSTADDDIEEKHHDGDGATTQLGRHLAIINMVAHRLGKPRSRATYLTRFVRPSEERERDWRPRRGKLRLVCGSAWKPLRVSR